MSSASSSSSASSVSSASSSSSSSSSSVAQIKDFSDLYWSSEEFDMEGVNLHCTFSIYINPSDDVYVSEIVERKANIGVPQLNASLKHVPRAIIFPKLSDLEDPPRRSQNPLLPNVAVNRSLLDKYVILKAYRMLDVLISEMAEEITAMEAISKNPHRYIVKYHGCQVRDGYVTGIVQDTYPLDLNHYIAGGATMSVQLFMSALFSAVNHLHSMGWVHNDIRPENILINDAGMPILSGFSMCRPIGRPLSVLSGADEWTSEGIPASHVQQDHYALNMLFLWLYENSVPYESPPLFNFGDWVHFPPLDM